MKYSILLLVLLSWIGTAHSSGSTSAIGSYRPKVIIRVTLGSPPPSCNRFGVCHIDVLPGWMRALPGEAVGSCEADDSGSRLTITISESTGIDATTLQRYFSDGNFVTEADYLLSDEVCNALQIHTGSFIPAGTWKAASRDGILTVVLNVK
ncbi:MAG TPA: hypothetical protein VFW78_12085 [Bacteroidia bacterium]|nr:hypothetical protein [Bacteroidia bacterium]